MLEIFLQIISVIAFIAISSVDVTEMLIYTDKLLKIFGVIFIKVAIVILVPISSFAIILYQVYKYKRM